jgi:ParB family chromosome partitioning protein
LDGAQQITAAEEIIQRNLSVREAEQLVKRLSAASPVSVAKRVENKDVLRLQEELADSIGANVQIRSGKAGAGMLKISYSSLDQLDGIIARLKKS